MGCIQTKQFQEEQNQAIKSNNKLALDFDIDLHYDSNDKNIHRRFIDKNNKNDSHCDSDESFHL